MEFLQRLIKKDTEINKIRVFTPEDARRVIQEKGLEGSMSLQNNIIGVNFSQTPKYIDTNPAGMCVVVPTSDGKKGSLSHLQDDVDVEKFADALKKYHNNSPTSVILSGGDTGISEHLITDICKCLSSRGFTLPRNETEADLGNIGGKSVYRIAALYPDKVEVIRKPYNGPQQTVTLKFPNYLPLSA